MGGRHALFGMLTLGAICVSLITFDCKQESQSSGGSPPSNVRVRLGAAFNGLSVQQPVDLQDAGDGTDRVFVVSQRGTITVIATDGSQSPRQFLDINSRLTWGGEMGLLGLAFHPLYESNGYFFVNYTAPSPLRTVISRFNVSAGNPDSADPQSELVLLEYAQPYSNHNGGQVAFGTDGYLYISSGDGGAGGDPHDNGQSKRSLLGKILRINVDASEGGRPYGIPSSNPFFQNDSGYAQEIYAYGLRNPWRISFDPVTGHLWAGDVGQNAWEEVDLIQNGGNYGWRFREGNHCYDPASNCSRPGLIDPVWEYAQSDPDGCSVTGGYVYRGSGIPALYGRYVYGDYCSGRIWVLAYDGSSQPTNEILLDSGLAISSFGVDRNNDLYICSYADGRIYKLLPN